MFQPFDGPPQIQKLEQTKIFLEILLQDKK